MLKMTAKRVLIVASFILLIGMTLQQCWQSKPDSEKWLYFFEDAARDYAGNVLGTGRGTDVAVPETLKGAIVTVHETYVTFSPEQDPDLVLAFSPGGQPGADESGRSWTALRDGWYVLSTRGGDAD